MERKFPAPGTQLCGLAWDGTQLWHSDAGTATIYAFDPVTGETRAELPCPGVRTDLTWSGEMLIQVVGQPKGLCYLRPNGEILGYRSLDLPSDSLCGLEATSDQLWLGLDIPGTIQLRHPVTLEVLRQFSVEGEVAGLTYLPGVVIYADYTDSHIRAIDADTGELISRRKIAGSPTGLTWDGTHLWYCDYDSKEICAIDADGLR